MIRDTLTLCSIASTLLKCMQDTENVRGRRGGICLDRVIETTYGVTVYVSIDMSYGWDYDNRSSISIEIDNKSIFKISFKYIDDDWKLVTFNDDRDKNTLLLDAVSEALVKLMMTDKNTLLLTAVSEALVKLMMTMVHTQSIHFSKTN